MNRRVRRCLTTLILLSAVEACGGASTNQCASTTRDSAGITFVEDPNCPAVGGAWRVDSVPLVTIGVENGPAPYRFSRIAGVVRLSDGRIVVADGGSREIRFYDSLGRYVRSVGRAGDGPGEFQVISLLRRYRGDSLIAWDFPARRLTIISPDGRVARTLQGPDVPGYLFFSPTDPFADGMLLGTVDPPFRFESATPGLHARETTYFRFDPGSGLVDTLGQLFGGETFVGTSHGHPAVFSPPFEKRPVVAVAGSELYYGSSRTFTIRTYSEGGTLIRVLRLLTASPPVTKTLVRDYIDHLLAIVPNANARRVMATRLHALPFPETLPAYGALLVDADTDLWVAKFPVLGEGVSEWTVFDPRGQVFGVVTTPARFEVYEIGRDNMLGVQRDLMDVERVVVFRIRKPALESSVD